MKHATPAVTLSTLSCSSGLPFFVGKFHESRRARRASVHRRDPTRENFWSRSNNAIRRVVSGRFIRPGHARFRQREALRAEADLPLASRCRAQAKRPTLWVTWPTHHGSSPTPANVAQRLLIQNLRPPVFGAEGLGRDLRACRRTGRGTKKARQAFSAQQVRAMEERGAASTLAAVVKSAIMPTGDHTPPSVTPPVLGRLSESELHADHIGRPGQDRR